MNGHECRRPGCSRLAPDAFHSGFCTKHDGLPYGPDVCICPTAVAIGTGECASCHHPIVSLHPGLISGLRIWPQLTHQTVIRTARAVA